MSKHRSAGIALAGVVLALSLGSFALLTVNIAGQERGEAASLGGSEAYKAARVLLVDGADPEHVAEGIALLTAAADDGVIAAQLQLGDVLARGMFGQANDYPAAAALYQVVGESGNVNGWLRLGALYRDGAPGLGRNGEKATEAYLRAIEMDNDLARRSLAGMLIAGDLVPADPQRAIALYREAFDNGDPWGAISLAGVYRWGRGVAPDPRAAIGLLTPLAESDNMSAMIALGDMLRAGATGLEARPLEALDLYRRAANLGNSSAARRLADMLIRGEGGAVDVKGGIELLEDLADEGVDAVLQPLGEYYSDQTLPIFDPGRAIGYFERSAENGNATALFRLGTLFRDGVQGLDTDGELARTYFEQGAEAGNNLARRALADMLLEGDLIDRDVGQGLALYQAAVDEGDVGGRLGLARVYRNGTGVEADWQQAASVLQPLVEAENLSALNQLGDMYRRGGPSLAQDVVAARDLFATAMELGNGTAARKFADMLAKGEGGPTDVDGAVTILSRLAEDGDPRAQLALGDIYANPAIGHADPTRAIEAYRGAADAGLSLGFQRLAALYRNGMEGLEPNPELALATLDEAASRPNASPSTLRVLADALLAGMPEQDDIDQGLALYAKAMGGGDRESALKLARHLASGQLVPADYDAAMAAFDAAIAAGHPTARVEKGKALLNGPLAKDHAMEGRDILRAAVADGDRGAALALAQSQVAGRISGETVVDAVDTLLGAVADADVSAIRYLIGLYRDGRSSGLPPDPQAARRLLDAQAGVLGEPIAAFEHVLLLGRMPVTSENLVALDTSLSALTDPLRRAALIRLRAINANGYVFMLQRELLARGLFAGPKDGLLTRGTIGAISAYCQTAGIDDVCGRGPLAPDAARALADALYAS